MKRLTKIILIFLTAILCLTVSACGNGSKSKAGQSGDSRAVIGEQIEDVLADTPACDGWAPSVVEMINTVFHSYSWDFEVYEDSKTSYIVKFTGSYSPNPDIPNLSQEGSISYLVDVESGEASVFSDPYDLSSTFMVYIVN